MRSFSAHPQLLALGVFLLAGGLAATALYVHRSVHGHPNYPFEVWLTYCELQVGNRPPPRHLIMKGIEGRLGRPLEAVVFDYYGDFLKDHPLRPDFVIVYKLQVTESQPMVVMFDALGPVEIQPNSLDEILLNAHSALWRFKVKHGVYPIKLDELERGAATYLERNARLLDPWGRPLVYGRTTGSYFLLSLGADGVASNDDIHLPPMLYSKYPAELGQLFTEFENESKEFYRSSESRDPLKH